MSEQLSFYEYAVEVIRKPYRRSMTLSLRADGSLRLLVGQSVPQPTIMQFIESKSAWLRKHLVRVEDLRKRYPAKQYQEGESFLFLGEKRELKYQVTPLEKVFVAVTGSEISVHIPLIQWPLRTQVSLRTTFRELIHSYYRREGVRHLTERVRFFSDCTGLVPKKLGFRAPKTRWGSCSSRGHISLNYKMMVAPPEVIDYVVLHELCHLRHLNHSTHFWELVAQHMPDYQACEKWLNDHHYEADFLSQKSQLHL